MGFSFIRKTASTGSSATGALVAANSLQPHWSTDSTTLNCLSLGKAKAKGITEIRACKLGTDYKPDFSNDLARRLYKV